MKKRPRIIVDDNIPFIKGRLEPFADTVYADQFGFTPELVRDADAMVIRTRTRCDENLLKDNGITCRNSPGCNAPGVAQYVWSALLRSGFDPERHTLGVVGCGNVGSIVADWGRRLGADVLVNDPPKAAAGASLPGLVELPELLREADAVTLHTPLTRDGEWPSFHLIGEAALALMKPGALLVNAARGPVADNAALRRAVASGHIRAVIDTWEGEPKLDKELLSLLKYGTFHIAGYSLEGKQRATRMVLEAIGEHFGFAPDLSGLEGPYKAPARISAKAILDSYNPISDTLQLKADPDAFDTLRANYSFRREPRFI